jgi:long-chain fatty acid transport protein
MKFKFALIAVASVSASSAYAGGMEVTRLPTSMMFEDGNHASLSFGKFSPDVTDNVYATNGSMYKDRSAITATFKTQISDKISIGFASYKSAEIQLDYSNASVLFSSQSLPDPYVDLGIETMALLGRYEVFNNISIVGGLKYSKGSGGGNVLSSPAGVIAAAEDTTLGGIIGLSYENPEIAMRISGVYQAKQDMEHATTTTVTGPTVISLEDTKSALPASFTIDFQTGIAADTLLFGSIHHALWDDAHISFWSLAGALGGTDGAGNGTGYVQKTTWTDTTSLSLGIGRKLSEKWSVSTSLNYEAPSEAAGTSLLSTTDGVSGITLGGKYTFDKMTLTAGVNYSQLGDKKVNPAGPLPEGSFTDNSVTSFGIKLGYNF